MRLPNFVDAALGGELEVPTLDATTDAIADALKKGETVSMVGFGTFSVRHRAARTGRNPRTGETINIAASNNPAFKAGKALKDAVN